MKTPLAFVLSLALLGGCANTDAERRLLIIKQARIVLQNSSTDPAWLEERAIVEKHFEEETADGE